MQKSGGQRALSGARLAEDAKDFSGAELEADAVQGVDRRGVPGRIGDREVADIDHAFVRSISVRSIFVRSIHCRTPRIRY